MESAIFPYSAPLFSVLLPQACSADVIGPRVSASMNGSAGSAMRGSAPRRTRSCEAGASLSRVTDTSQSVGAAGGVRLASPLTLSSPLSGSLGSSGLCSASRSGVHGAADDGAASKKAKSSTKGGGDTPHDAFANHYKTRLCRTFIERGCCPYGDRCRFAHGDAQRRTYGQNQRDGLTSEVAVQEYVRIAVGTVPAPSDGRAAVTSPQDGSVTPDALTSARSPLRIASLAPAPMTAFALSTTGGGYAPLGSPPPAAATSPLIPSPLRASTAATAGHTPTAAAAQQQPPPPQRQQQQQPFIDSPRYVAESSSVGSAPASSVALQDLWYAMSLGGATLSGKIPFTPPEHSGDSTVQQPPAPPPVSFAADNADDRSSVNAPGRLSRRRDSLPGAQRKFDSARPLRSASPASSIVSDSPHSSSASVDAGRRGHAAQRQRRVEQYMKLSLRHLLHSELGGAGQGANPLVRERAPLLAADAPSAASDPQLQLDFYAGVMRAARLLFDEVAEAFPDAHATIALPDTTPTAPQTAVSRAATATTLPSVTVDHATNGGAVLRSPQLPPAAGTGAGRGFAAANQLQRPCYPVTSPTMCSAPAQLGSGCLSSSSIGAALSEASYAMYSAHTPREHAAAAPGSQRQRPTMMDDDNRHLWASDSIRHSVSLDGGLRPALEEEELVAENVLEYLTLEITRELDDDETVRSA